MDMWNKEDTQFEDQGFSDQMQDLGFDSLNSFLNLGSLSFFLMLYVVKNIILALMLITVVKKYGWLKEFVP